MKLLKTISAVLICISFFSAKPANTDENKVTKDPQACTYALNIDNSAGVHTISKVTIEWPGASFTYFPNLAGGLTTTYYLPVTPSFPMKYLVKVTLWWTSPAVGPKLRLYANSPYTLIGAFNSTSNLLTATVNGSGGATATYCQGVTVIVGETI